MKVDYRNRQPSVEPRCTSAQTAFRIAAAWPDSIPSVDSLRTRFSMSRATAYRWISALKAARGSQS